jgi:molybdenum cofactor synthesis domain-containing protein
LTEASTRARFGLVIIGDEVLGARVVEANAAYLLEAIRDLGGEVREVVFVGDAPEVIAEAVLRQSARCDVVLTTGGIGPTHDDVTMGAVAGAFGLGVVEHPIILDALGARAPLTPARRRLARVPDGAEVVFGTGVPWPVARIHNVWLLPGVPPFVRGLFQAIRDRFPRSPLRTRLLVELVAEESSICEALDALAARHGAVAIGSYPRPEPDGWRVRLTFEGSDPTAVTAAHAEALTCFAAWLSPGP